MTKYDLRAIMVRAWTIRKTTGKSMSESLHQSWVLAKMESIGNLWEKYGKSRIYFDFSALRELAGLELTYYKTGNISSAKINGELVSNAEGRRWITKLDGMFFDLMTGCFGNKYTRTADADVVEMITAYAGC